VLYPRSGGSETRFSSSPLVVGLLYANMAGVCLGFFVLKVLAHLERETKNCSHPKILN
jgi:hypothetical protein